MIISYALSHITLAFSWMIILSPISLSLHLMVPTIHNHMSDLVEEKMFYLCWKMFSFLVKNVFIFGAGQCLGSPKLEGQRRIFQSSWKLLSSIDLELEIYCRMELYWIERILLYPFPDKWFSSSPVSDGVLHQEDLHHQVHHLPQHHF